MVNVLRFEQDMAKEVQLRQLHGSLYQADNNGLKIECAMYRNGVAEQLSGSIIAHVVRSDGTLATVTGVRVGNIAAAELPTGCLMPGTIRVALKNIDGSRKTTLLAFSGVVSIIDGSAYVDPASVIPSLTDYGTLVTRAEAAATTISHLSTSATLISGDRYRCDVTLSS